MKQTQSNYHKTNAASHYSHHDFSFIALVSSGTQNEIVSQAQSQKACN